MNITSPHISNGHLSSTCHPLLLLSDTENVYLREKIYSQRKISDVYVDDSELFNYFIISLQYATVSNLHNQ